MNRNLRALRAAFEDARRAMGAPLAAALDRAITRLEPKRRGPAKPGPTRAEDRAEQREAASARRCRVYATVDRRSGGLCEQVGPVILCRNDATEHDHFWGRGKARETPQNVWHLCKFHHDNKTRNDPNRAAWIRFFRQHCYQHAFWADLEKCDRALALEEGQHPARRAPLGHGGTK